jgi:predicted ATPase
MKRYIVTGAPGAGKTAIIRQLEIDGFGVVEEAATDVIALCHANGIGEPWNQKQESPARPVLTTSCSFMIDLWSAPLP